MSHSAVPSELLELGHEAIAKIAFGVTAGASLVHCQLVASQFYEALQSQWKRTSLADSSKMGLLAAVLDQCRRSVDGCLSPTLMLAELSSAMAMLEDGGRPTVSARHRPVLRVIQGGRGQD